MKEKRPKKKWIEGIDPQYREPQYHLLSDLVAGRIQAGPHSTPPRDGTDLEHWQDPEWFHSPEL